MLNDCIANKEKLCQTAILQTLIIADKRQSEDTYLQLSNHQDTRTSQEKNGRKETAQDHETRRCHSGAVSWYQDQSWCEWGKAGSCRLFLALWACTHEEEEDEEENDDIIHIYFIWLIQGQMRPSNKWRHHQTTCMRKELQEHGRALARRSSFLAGGKAIRCVFPGDFPVRLMLSTHCCVMFVRSPYLYAFLRLLPAAPGSCRSLVGQIDCIWFV